jgi:hypothetical protein
MFDIKASNPKIAPTSPALQATSDAKDLNKASEVKGNNL